MCKEKKTIKRTLSLLLLLVVSVISATAQNVLINGKVSDAEGKELPGVTVKIKGTGIVSTTDADGHFQLSAPHQEKGTLIFSYVGFDSKELAFSGKQHIYNVVLQELSNELNEVVVVGYGVQKKANLTGSVASVRVDDIKDVPVSNTSSLLQGRMSGVTVSSFSAQPGKNDDVEIRIRGIGTFNNNNPLILIDGVEGSLSNVSPNDIESISVLKDAASASIYGVRAGNGVILVTTKTGAGTANRLSYNGSFGTSSATVLPSYLPSWKWATLFNEENNQLGGDAPLRNYTDDMITKLKNGSDTDGFANTNWMKKVFHSAFVTNHYLSMSGGNATSKYLTSIGYLSQDGIMRGTSTDRLNFRMNADTKYFKMLTLGTNVSGSYQKVKEPMGGTWNIFNEIVNHVRPTVPVNYSNGYWGEYDGNPQFPSYQMNPVKETTYTSHDRIYRFDGKVYADFEPVKNLHFKTSFAYQYNQSETNWFDPTHNHYKADGTYTTTGIAAAEEDRVTNLQWINENLITYNFNLFDDHHFAFLLGESTQWNQNKYTESKGENFLSNTAHSLDAAQNTSSYGRKYTATLRSFFARMNYSYKNRYLLEANLRRDESSRLPKNNRTGYFPSFSVGWNLAEESFMSQQKLLNELKLRASWGTLGNQEIGYYPYAQTYSLGQTNYVWGDSKVIGAALASAANPDIKWETTKTTDLGIDMVVANKVSLTFDYFNKVTSDILLQLPISALIGVDDAPYVNAAKVRNRGWELNLGYNDKIGDFSYHANLNLSRIENKILSVSGRTNWIDNWTINIAGEPIGAYYGLKADGLYTSQKEIDATAVSFGTPRIGDIKYEDISGPDGKPDGKITDDDRTVIGNPFPKITYGLNVGCAYRGFDFSVLFQGVGKVDRVMMDYPTIGGGATERMWDRYSESDNPTGTFPRLGNVSYNSLPSSFWIADASYLRMKNLELGYTINHDLLKKIRINTMRIYLSVQNLFTITDVKNYDPEKYSSDSNNATYPNAKTFSIGLNVNI
jgi:TonB-linked SusC/RagA family outer membrane protein